MGKNDSFYDSLRNFGAPKKSSSNFNHKLRDGTSIFGPKKTEGKAGHKHGHSGSNFYRTPHSSLGSAAIGRGHTSKGHTTHRW